MRISSPFLLRGAGRAGADLDGIGQADTAQHAARRRLCAPCRETGPVGRPQGKIHAAREIA